MKNYDPAADLGDLILNAKYNDVTATILYAFVLERLSIPYHITQYPAHVFVNVGAENVKFETLDAVKGVYIVNAASKQKLVVDAIKTGYI